MTIPVKKISSFCKTGSGGTPSRSNNAFFENGTIPWVKSGELKNRYITEVEEYITELAVEKSSAKLVSKGSLLIAMYGATVGEVSQLTFDATTNQAICNIQPDENVCDVNYLYRFLEASKPYLLSRRVGGGQPNISQGVIKDLDVPLPPLAEQRRIASILDQADELRQKRQQAIEKLDQLLQVTFIDMFGDPVSNPKGWEVGSLNNYGSYKNGLNFGKGESGNQVLYIGVGDFKQLSKIDDVSKLSTIDLDELPSADYFIKNGDLLFVRSNGNKELVGRCIAVYPDEKLVTYSGFCIRYRIERSELTSAYLVHLFRAKSFKQTIFDGGQGANIQNINQQLLSRLQIPIPPKDLQEKWSKILLSIEDQKQNLYKQLDMQNQLFSSLQNQAFSGTL
ncbi:restriction endonuclease subunit S [Acinetobacter sp. YH12075]|uniref:restriction endonuclease subunit S n=1 Tax=Acinetobacter sp. YH12075 TaxID=2601070 RepID=UPI0015D1D38E|nr:restriction endonuclease subunit S [Acinetobacter sp. YH12075]